MTPEQRMKLEQNNDNKEEMEHCKDPVYFYNKYVRHPDKKEVTRTEYVDIVSAQMLVRNKSRNRMYPYPLIPEGLCKPE